MNKLLALLLLLVYSGLHAQVEPIPACITCLFNQDYDDDQILDMYVTLELKPHINNYTSVFIDGEIKYVDGSEGKNEGMTISLRPEARNGNKEDLYVDGIRIIFNNQDYSNKMMSVLTKEWGLDPDPKVSKKTLKSAGRLYAGKGSGNEYDLNFKDELERQIVVKYNMSPSPWIKEVMFYNMENSEFCAQLCFEPQLYNFSLPGFVVGERAEYWRQLGNVLTQKDRKYLEDIHSWYWWDHEGVLNSKDGKVAFKLMPKGDDFLITEVIYYSREQEVEVDIEFPYITTEQHLERFWGQTYERNSYDKTVYFGELNDPGSAFTIFADYKWHFEGKIILEKLVFKPLDADQINISTEANLNEIVIKTGCISGNCREGEGVLRYIDGYSFKGKFRDGWPWWGKFYDVFGKLDEELIPELTAKDTMTDEQYAAWQKEQVELANIDRLKEVKREMSNMINLCHNFYISFQKYSQHTQQSYRVSNTEQIEKFGDARIALNACYKELALIEGRCKGIKNTLYSQDQCYGAHKYLDEIIENVAEMRVIIDEVSNKFGLDLEVQWINWFDSIDTKLHPLYVKTGKVALQLRDQSEACF